MSQTVRKKLEELNANQLAGEEERKGRRRSPTLLKMQWLAERVRKAERIRKQVQNGTYHADSKEVAKSLLGKEIG